MKSFIKKYLKDLEKKKLVMEDIDSELPEVP